LADVFEETLTFRGKHPIPPMPRSNTVLTMVGIWFAVLVAAFIAAGILTQLGWEPPSMPALRWVFRRARDTHRDTPGSVGGQP
jgi:hypothetical protein